jgi:hypothetical protein
MKKVKAGTLLTGCHKCCWDGGGACSACKSVNNPSCVEGAHPHACGQSECIIIT